MRRCSIGVTCVSLNFCDLQIVHCKIQWWQFFVAKIQETFEGWRGCMWQEKLDRVLKLLLWPFPVLLEVVGKSSWHPSCDFWGPLHYCVMCEPLCSASKVFHDCAEGPDFHSLHWWRLCNRDYFGHWFKGAEWYAQSIWQVMGWGALFRGCQLTTSQVSFWGSAV